MDTAKKLELLEDMLNVDPGFLKPEMELKDIDEWDSLARLSLVVLMDDEFEKAITAEDIAEFKTVKNILDFMG